MKNGSYFPGRGTLVEETFLEGKAEGIAEGEARGEAKGEAKGKADSVLHLLEWRGIPVTPAQRARITTCTDPGTLDTWLERAFTATDPGHLFEEDETA